MFWRRWTEKMLRGTCWKRRLPARFGRVPLYLSPDARLSHLKPGAAAFDAQLLEVVARYVQSDAIVWDIGANVGVFAFAAASCARQGAVIAVEADIWLAQMLQRSARIPENKVLPITVLPCAIAAADGVASFQIAARGRAANSLATIGDRSVAGGTRYQVHVPTLTLDTLLDFFSPPTMLKVDVEGAEVLVMQGARRLLAEARPVIYIEVGSETNAAVTRILSANDYSLFDGAVPIGQQVPAGQCFFNTLALPRERLSQLV